MFDYRKYTQPAEGSGVKVTHWTQEEIEERCPPVERSLLDEEIHYNQSKMQNWKWSR